MKKHLVIKLLMGLIVIGSLASPSVGQISSDSLARDTQITSTQPQRKAQSTSKSLPGVPGQSVQQVLEWSKSHSLLPPLKLVKKLEQHYPDYHSVVQLGQKPGKSASYIAFEVFAFFKWNRRKSSY